jgi:hypothetical protein
MESFRTIFRAVVMLIVVVIGYKGWQHFGPPAEQVKSIAVRALEWAKSAIDQPGPIDAAESTLAVDPRPLAPPLGEHLSPVASSPAVMQAQALVPVADPATIGGGSSPEFLAPPALSPVSPVENEGTVPVGGMDQQLQSLYTRLTELGAHDLELAPWGSGGELHRFCCRASLAGSEQFSRHFEAIAAQPQTAVEGVLAKIESWRIAQGREPGSETILR